MLTYLLPSLDIWSQMWTARQMPETSLAQQMKQLQLDRIAAKQEAAQRYEDAVIKMYEAAIARQT